MTAKTDAHNEEDGISSIAIEEKDSKTDPIVGEFLQKFSSLATHEEKIHFALETMRKALSQEGSPNFRSFWEIRNQCFLLFKEHLNSAVRSRFWSEYVELSDEAQRLAPQEVTKENFVLENLLNLALFFLKTI